MSPSAVLFDMDGLLLDTERLTSESYDQARQEFGLGSDKDGYLKCIGSTGAASDRVILENLEGKVDVPAFRRRWREIKLARLRREVPVKPGARRLISLIAKKRIPMGVATSTETGLALFLLQSAGILDHLQCVIGKDLVSQYKPDPEPYLVLADRIGVSCKECIAFEDSDVGTKAAIASGAQTVQVPDLLVPSPTVMTLGHIIASDLEDGARRIGLLEALSGPE